MKILVCGSSGFISGHLVRRLMNEGHDVLGIDLVDPRYTKPTHFIKADLRDPAVFKATVGEVDEVYQLACNMGGCQFIFTGDNNAEIMTSAMIDLNLCQALVDYNKTAKVFYSSSACMYPQELQRYSRQLAPGEKKSGKTIPYAPSLKELDAYPANPDSEYGWQKLFSERLYLAYVRNYGLDVRIARFHNIYGPEGTWKGGKEKAPASISRKVAEAKDKVQIWGNGLQTRSFLYIEDCMDAVQLLMQSDFKEPINIGSNESVTINELWEMAVIISGKNLAIEHIERPANVLGVQARNSNNDLIEKVLNWKRKYSLMQGMALTYKWINQQVNEKDNS